MKLLFASGRERLNSVDWDVEVESGGNLTSGNYYFSLQGQNRIGKNLLLTSGLISVTDGSKVKVTINSTALRNGEGWRHFVIGINSTNNPATFKQIGRINIFFQDADVPDPFPLTLTFSNRDHLQSAKVLTAFPTTDRVNGQTVRYTPTGFVYQYDAYDNETPIDNQLVFPGSTGRWKYIESENVYVDNIVDIGGSSLNLLAYENADYLDLPDYVPSNSSSDSVEYWMLNDSNATIFAGTRIGITAYLGDLNKSQFFNNKLLISIKGYVNTNTGVLRTKWLSDNTTQFDNLNEEIQFDVNYPNLTLPDDLLNNEAVVLRVRLKFKIEEVDGLIPETFVKILPSFIPNAAIFNPAGDFLGDGLIIKEGDFRRIVPGNSLDAIALSGRGVVKSYSFPFLRESNVTGFLANTENQKVLINRNGQCYRTTLTTPADATPRAFVSTKVGESDVSPWCNNITVEDGQRLTFTLTYPCTSEGNGRIREDYNDVIASNNKGRFNPASVNIYIENVSTGVIRKFSGLTVINEPTQQFTINDFTNGTVVESVNETIPFGLYKPIGISRTATGGGSFTAGTYRACYAFVYNGNQITDITHRVEDGCIAEAYKSISNLFDESYWLNSVKTLNDLRNIDTKRIGSGAFVFVDDIKGFYYYNPDTNYPDNNDNFIEPNLGTGNFISQGVNKESIINPRTFFVDSNNGNNNNDGLSELSAFKDIPYALDLIRNKYVIDAQIEVKLLDGTYTIDRTINLLNFVGNGSIALIGNLEFPSQVKITNAIDMGLNDVGGGKFRMALIKVANKGYSLSGFKLEISNHNNLTNISQITGISTTIGDENLGIDKLVFGDFKIAGTTNAQTFNIINYGTNLIVDNYEINGDVDIHLYQAESGKYYSKLPNENPATSPVTIVGSPAIDTLFYVLDKSLVNLAKITISGSFTGKAYHVSNYAILNLGSNTINSSLGGDVLDLGRVTSNTLSLYKLPDNTVDVDAIKTTNSPSVDKILKINDTNQLIWSDDTGAPVIKDGSGVALPTRQNLIVGEGLTVTDNSIDNATVIALDTSDGGGAAGHTIKNASGATLAQQPNLKFGKGFVLTNDAANEETDIEFRPSSEYLVYDSFTALTTTNLTNHTTDTGQTWTLAGAGSIARVMSNTGILELNGRVATISLVTPGFSPLTQYEIGAQLRNPEAALVFNYLSVDTFYFVFYSADGYITLARRISNVVTTIVSRKIADFKLDESFVVVRSSATPEEFQDHRRYEILVNGITVITHLETNPSNITSSNVGMTNFTTFGTTARFRQFYAKYLPHSVQLTPFTQYHKKTDIPSTELRLNSLSAPLQLVNPVGGNRIVVINNDNYYIEGSYFKIVNINATNNVTVMYGLTTLVTLTPTKKIGEFIFDGSNWNFWTY